MATPHAATPNVVTAPTRTRIVAEEVLLLARRSGWMVPPLALLLALCLAWPLMVSWPARDRIGVMLNHSTPWPGFSLTPWVGIGLGLYFAAAVWRGVPPSARGHLLSMPADRSTLLGVRIITGAAFLLLTLLMGWYAFVGFVYLGFSVGGSPQWTFGFLPPPDWLAWFLGIVNVYLLGTLFALRYKQPFRILLIWGTLFFVVTWGIYICIESVVVRAALSVVLPPWGLLAGLGLSVWNGAGILTYMEPRLWAPVAWGVLLVAGVLYSLRKSVRFSEGWV